MSFNLLDMLKDQVTGQLANQASSFLGESESSVTKALGGIFPALLGSTIEKVQEPSGADGLMGLIKGVDSGMLGNIAGLFGGGASNVNGLLNSGGGILDMLLGDKLGGLVGMISKLSGLGSGSSSSLLKMAAPFLMGIIGKKLGGGGVSGLLDMLMGQKDHVAKAMPSGMGNLLGLGFAADMAKDAMGAVGNAGKAVADTAGDVAKGAANVASNAGRATANAGRATANAAGEAASSGLSFLKWLLPLLLIGGLLWWFFMRGGADKTVGAVGDAVNKTTEIAKDAGNAVGDVAKTGANAVGNAAGAVGSAIGSVFGKVDAAAKAAMDKITFAAGSAGAQIKDFISGGFKGDGNFRFKNLNFATGSAEIKDAKEVDNLAAILKAYPNVNVTINGYTDNTGDAAKNVALSNARASSVMGRLIAQGIAANRISAKGHGAANPVASNDTAEGRAQNRRIEISINK